MCIISSEKILDILAKKKPKNPKKQAINDEASRHDLKYINTVIYEWLYQQVSSFASYIF